MIKKHITLIKINYYFYKGKDFNSYLDECYKKKVNIEKETVIKWLKQLVTGLKELHSHKCHHRDLKPGFDLPVHYFIIKNY